MARPKKDGVDYFPLDVRMDDKFELIEAEYGLIGFAVVLKLYQRIYELGYYCEWTTEAALLFAKQNGLANEILLQILGSALQRGIFDRRLFDTYRILTSVGIQRRYFTAVTRRETINVERRYLLVDLTQYGINARINWVNECEPPIDVCRNPQRKPKERKPKETKGKESKEAAGVSARRNADADASESAKTHTRTRFSEYVSMTDQEKERLVSQYGEETTQAAIERLDSYKGSVGREYQSDYRAILSWVIGDLRIKRPELFARHANARYAENPGANPFA